jgi:hypothetical protein
MRLADVVLAFTAWGESEKKSERVEECQRLRSCEYIENVATVTGRTKTIFTAEDSAVSTPRVIASRISMSSIILVLLPNHIRAVFWRKGN